MGLVSFYGSGALSRHLDGIPSEAATGLLAGIAAAAPGHTVALRINNIDDYSGKYVSDNGGHNFDPIPPDLDTTVLVDAVERSLPGLLLNPPEGKRYRIIIDASSTGLVPSAPDGSILEIDLQTSPGGRQITPLEDGSITVSP